MRRNGFEEEWPWPSGMMGGNGQIGVARGAMPERVGREGAARLFDRCRWGRGDALAAGYFWRRRRSSGVATVSSPLQSGERSADEEPQGLEHQPEHECEQQREDNPFGGQRECRHPIAPGGKRETAIQMKCQVSDLVKQAGVQRVGGALPLLHGVGNVLNGCTVGVKDGVATGEVVLDEFVEIALEELICDVLPRFQVKPGLIQAAT